MQILESLMQSTSRLLSAEWVGNSFAKIGINASEGQTSWVRAKTKRVHVTTVLKSSTVGRLSKIRTTSQIERYYVQCYSTLSF
jgi:hypothetical protein